MRTRCQSSCILHVAMRWNSWRFRYMCIYVHIHAHNTLRLKYPRKAIRRCGRREKNYACLIPCDLASCFYRDLHNFHEFSIFAPFSTIGCALFLRLWFMMRLHNLQLYQLPKEAFLLFAIQIDELHKLDSITVYTCIW